MDSLRAITDIATQQLGAEGATIDVDAPLAQLGVDSLGFLELLFELEDQVGVPLPPDALKDATTLRELAGRVDEIVAKGAAEPKAEPAAD